MGWVFGLKLTNSDYGPRIRTYGQGDYKSEETRQRQEFKIRPLNVKGQNRY